MRTLRIFSSTSIGTHAASRSASRRLIASQEGASPLDVLRSSRISIWNESLPCPSTTQPPGSLLIKGIGFNERSL